MATLLLLGGGGGTSFRWLVSLLEPSLKSDESGDRQHQQAWHAAAQRAWEASGGIAPACGGSLQPCWHFMIAQARPQPSRKARHQAPVATQLQQRVIAAQPGCRTGSAVKLQIGQRILRRHRIHTQ